MSDIKAILKELKAQGTSAIALNECEYTTAGVIKSGSLGLDYALSIGGYPRGRIVEIYGAPTSGKSSMAYMAIKELQRTGGVAAYVDAEYTLDRAWLEKLGIDTSTLLIAQSTDKATPMTGEQCLQFVENFVKAGADLVVLDSVAALVPQAQLAEDIGGAKQLGMHARMMSEGLRRLTAVIGQSKATVIFINQTRTNPGIMFGNPENTSGGEALKFYASVRLRVTKLMNKESLYTDDSGDIIGHKTRIKVVKNKVGIPFRECEFDFYYESGIDVTSELLQAALKKGIITHPNNVKYEYAGQSYHGEKEISNAIKTNKQIQESLKEQLSVSD